MAGPIRAKKLASRRRPVRPGHRNALARQAQAERLSAKAVAAQLGDKRCADTAGQSQPQGIFAGLRRVLREDRPVLGLVAMFLAAAGWLVWTSALVPPTLAQIIARMPSVAVQARSDAAVVEAGLAAGREPVVSADQGLAERAVAQRVVVNPIALLSPVDPDVEAAAVSPDNMVAALDQDISDAIGRGRACTVEEAAFGDLSLSAPAAAADMADQDPAFGARLAAAAEAQTGDFVVYKDSYRNLSFPMGDVSALYGVCTDVVIRAYRALGIDLQAAVKQAGVGSGDPNIDHRRTDVLRRFFARSGAEVAASDFAEDYLPGDVVSYHRPQNAGSQSHIAIVSSRMSRAGRLMVVHNRGWGPQIEDALFVDKITGHYRYRGAPPKAAISSAKLPKLKIISKKANRAAKAQGARSAAKSKFRNAANKKIAARTAQRRNQPKI